MGDDSRRSRRITGYHHGTHAQGLKLRDESGRVLTGGALSASSPMSCMDAGGPAATAKTLKPCFPSSSAIPAAVGDRAVRPMTTEKVPLMMRCTRPFGAVAVASDVFFAGSNSTNLVSWGSNAWRHGAPSPKSKESAVAGSRNLDNIGTALVGIRNVVGLCPLMVRSQFFDCTKPIFLR